MVLVGRIGTRSTALVPSLFEVGGLFRISNTHRRFSVTYSFYFFPIADLILYSSFLGNTHVILCEIVAPFVEKSIQRLLIQAFSIRFLMGGALYGKPCAPSLELQDPAHITGKSPAPGARGIERGNHGNHRPLIIHLKAGSHNRRVALRRGGTYKVTVVDDQRVDWVSPARTVIV
jgi:hypothetical protein